MRQLHRAVDGASAPAFVPLAPTTPQQRGDDVRTMKREQQAASFVAAAWTPGLMLTGFISPIQVSGQEPSPTTRAKSVAVLDFAMGGDRADNLDNWAVGLAEFMAAALQERGIATLERRDLRYVLSERKLHSQGAVRPNDVIRTQLPWVRYLLVGEIAPRAADRFDLSVSLIDAQDGHEALRESVTGDYPKDVARGIVELAGKTASGLGRPGELPSPIRAIRPGFTNAPEIALRYYQGLEWLIAGRPEFAEQHFRQAINMDKTFHVARLWRMKAFRSLGLDDFAQSIQQELAQDRVGRSLLESLDSGMGNGDKQVVVTIVAPPSPSDRDPRLEDALARALIKEPGMRIFRPRRIHELADESDLELTGEFENRVLSDGLILAADMLISVSHESSDSHAKPTVEMRLVDAVTGELWATGSRSCAASPSETCCTELFRELFARRGVGAPAPQTPLGLRPLDYRPASLISGLGSSEHRYAYYLRAFAANPKDREALIVLLAAHDWLFVHQRQGEEEATLRGLLARRLLGLIEDDEPDAANWLSQAVWILVRSKSYTQSNGLGNPIPNDLFEQTLQPLVTRYPASLAAFYAQYATAIERASAGRHEAAAELLDRLADRLPEFCADDWPDTFKANLFFFAAREADLVGEAQRARQFITAAEDEVRSWTTEMRTKHNFQLFGVVHAAYGDCSWGDGIFYSRSNGMWIQTLGRSSPYLNYRLSADTLRRSVETTLAGEISALRTRIFGEAKAPSLHDLFSRAASTAGHEGVTARLEYLRRLADLARRGEPLEERHVVLNAAVSIQWLADLMPRDQIPQLHKIAMDLADAFEAKKKIYHADPQKRFHLYMAAAMYAEAGELADRMLSTSDAYQRSLAVYAKAKVLLETETVNQVARFLDTELCRFERDFKSPYSVHHSQLAMRCAWAYRVAGQGLEAERVYQRGMDAPLHFPSSESTRQYKASMAFEVAKLREERGEIDGAAAMLKQVIEACEGQQWGLIRASEIWNTVPLGQQAVERLERLRGKRVELTPMLYGVSAERLLDYANRSIAAGDVSQGIEYLQIVVQKIKGQRWDVSGGFSSEEDFSLAARAETRLAELRVTNER